MPAPLISMQVGSASAAKGLQRLQRKLPEKVRHRPLLAVAKVVERVAKRTAVFKDKTGALRKSIKARASTRKGRKNILVSAGVYGRGGDGAVAHAHVVEFGHGGPHPADPHPFMREAAEKSLDATFEAVTRGIQKELSRIKL